LNIASQQHVHQKQITPPEKANLWQSLVHLMIGNMKKFIKDTFHGISSCYLQGYLDEFCFRFNRKL
jgi:hypothetical protein